MKKIDRIKFIISSLFGIGRIKGGGTISAIITIIGIYFLNWRGFPFYILIVGWTAIGIWAGYGKEKEDPKEIVIDESIGMMFAVLFHSNTLLIAGIALALFRILDIFKIPRFNLLEQKKGGVVYDDVFYGILTNILIWIGGIWIKVLR